MSYTIETVINSSTDERNCLIGL